MNRTAYFILLLISVCQLSFAQINDKHICGNSHEPELLSQNEKEALLKKINLLSKSGTEKSNALKIIPIVFHVLHQNGIENISDAQINDQIEILNEDFKRLNADTIDVLAPFDSIIGNANFEFRLATIDPNGNPCSGIDRIFTPLTISPTSFAPINLWNTLNYVNVYVVGSLGFTAGYSSNPLSPSNTDPCDDILVLIHNYVGSIGTSNLARSRALTHEMGHFFGLFHTWGDNNTPSLGCGTDDGLTDTPMTIGNSTGFLTSNTCDDMAFPASAAYWGYNVIDNVQNFMEYAFVSNMFTKQQATLMQSVIENPIYGRSNLFTNANLLATGVANPYIALTLPNANFTVNPLMKCAGASVAYQASFTSTPATYSWSFPGGSPSTSSAPNPTVIYASAGIFPATLTVNYGGQSATNTLNQSVLIHDGWAYYAGSHLQNMNTSPVYWETYNYDQSTDNFAWQSNGGVANTGCYKLAYQPFLSPASWCGYTGSNPNYGQKDALITPAFDLRYTTGIQISFDYANANVNATDAISSLNVYSSRDCGTTWILKANIENTDLISTALLPGVNFIPNASDWKTKTFNYTSNLLDGGTRFKFEFTASDSSHNLYIDNFKIDGLLFLEENPFDFSISPNPIQVGKHLTVSLNTNFVNMYQSNALVLSDAQGREINQTKITEMNQQIDLSNCGKGIYFLSDLYGKLTPKKIVVY